MDSAGLTSSVGNSAGSLNDYVSGYEVHGSVSFNNFILRGNYMTASYTFQSGELAFNGRGAEPDAWLLEQA